ncbi:MAG: trehalose-phosphatase [Pseudomonadota bacterium]
MISNSSNPSFSGFPQPSSQPEASGALPRITADTALFLDFDGTLVDIAAQPDLVQVPDSLPALLLDLKNALGGALAIVTGRKLTDIDAFLAPLVLPAAAEHGAQLRLEGGKPSSISTPNLSEVSRVAQALVAQHAGLKVEIKMAAVAVHYRQAPELATLCLEAMAEAVKRSPGLELLQGKCVIDIKAAGSSKGSAIISLMGKQPFVGRVPLFVGDDTTDEAGFAAVQDIGGEGLKVGAGQTLASHRCSDPEAVRQWLMASLQNIEGHPA